eukprot:5272373-Pyramimonas_sp.AAC.1
MLTNILCRPPKRSYASTAEAPRVTVDLLFPADVGVLAQFLQLRHLRRSALPGSAFFGSTLMYNDPDAMILEFNRPTSLHHYWPLCTQLLVLSDSRALVYSEASSDTWVEVLDRCMLGDPLTAATKLKWKPSRGGRAVATPSVVASTLAATTRRAKQNPNLHDYVTDLKLQGEVGRGDAEVLRRILNHACTATGLTLTEAVNDAMPKPGEFYHLASRNKFAPP